MKRWIILIEKEKFRCLFYKDERVLNFDFQYVQYPIWNAMLCKITIALVVIRYCIKFTCPINRNNVELI